MDKTGRATLVLSAIMTCRVMVEMATSQQDAVRKLEHYYKEVEQSLTQTNTNKEN